MLPTKADLDEVFRLKYGDMSSVGWGPRLRKRFGYFTPEDHYEASVKRLVAEHTEWLDVGCGRQILPNNPALARHLADRCRRLVGLDPDPTLSENGYVHEKVALSMERFHPERKFDLVTIRMVAEHVADPQAFTIRVGDVLKPGGLAVVYTVNRYSPVPLVTSLVPVAFRHSIKRFLWSTESKDTFPTVCRMNGRRRLCRLFRSAGLEEVAFLRLDDCRSFGRFRPLAFLELVARSGFRALRLPYPEFCLLGIYRKRDTNLPS